MRSILLVLSATLTACAASPRIATAPVTSGSPYLFALAGDKDEKDEDFFAVIDVRPGSATLGKTVATLPIGMKASMPHHMEYWTPGSGELLFANAHHHEASFLVDTSDPLKPRMALTLRPPAPLRYGHDFARLPNGNVLAGFLRSEGPSPARAETLAPAAMAVSLNIVRVAS